MISICMPAFNVTHYIDETIESIIKQSFSDWELIIVDDGSSDGTFEKASDQVSEKIRVFRQQNKGAAAARNEAFRHAKGNYIKFMDADDLLSQDMLAEQYHLALSNPRSIVSAKWGRFYGNDLTTFKLSPESCWKTSPSLEWIKKSWEKALPMTQPGIFLIEKSMIDRVGLWDETLSLNDDMEFFTKIILSSEKVVFAENSILYYRSGLGNKALSATKSEKGMISNYNSIKKSIKYLFEKEYSKETKLLAANILQSLVYDFYLSYPRFCNQVEKEIKDLGGSNLKLPSGRMLAILAKIMGWKMAKKIHKYF